MVKRLFVYKGKFINAWVLIFLLICTTSCSQSSPRNNTNNNINGVSLGILPNGSSFDVSQGNFPVTSNGQTITGTFFLVGGSANYTGVVTTSMSNSLLRSKVTSVQTMPTVTLTPTPCILIAGNPSQSSCQLNITIAASVPNGVYNVTPTFMDTNGNKTVLNSFTITVSAGNPANPGDISITATPSLIIGESSIATLSLTGSSGVSDLVINVASQNGTVLNVNPSNCRLSSSNNSCSIILVGLESGSTTLVASGSGYLATSNTINVSSVTRGNLSIALSSESLTYQESATVTVSLVGAIGINNLTVNLASLQPGIANVNPTSCVIAGSESGQNTCQVTVTASNESGLATIQASAESYTTKAQAVLSVSPPFSLITISLVLPTESTLSYAGVATPIVIAFSGMIESTSITTNSFMLGTTPGGSDIVAESIIIGASSESAIFIPSSILNIATTYYITLTSGVVDESGYPLRAFSESFTTQPESYTIFLATNNESGWPGNLYQAAKDAYPLDASVIDGVTGADAICQHDSQCLGWNCKAMLVESTGTTRQAVPTPVNWVLQPYTAYQNASGSPIGITGTMLNESAALYPWIFADDLESTINSGGSVQRGWTGMNSSWTLANTCGSWSSESTNFVTVWVLVPQEVEGIGTLFKIIALTQQVNCSATPTTNGVYCVQQP